MEFAGVVTAGGRVDGAFARAIGTRVKGLARIRGATMLECAIGALRGIGVERVAVIGGAEIAPALPRGVRLVNEGMTGEENLRRALRAWDSQTPLLYVTSDMPFITPRALQAFVDAAPRNAIALPLCDAVRFSERFPGAAGFGITLAGERVVNGGAFLIPADAAPAIESLAAQFFRSRKSPLRMAALAGLPLMLRFLARRLSIAHLEARAQRLLGIPARAVRGVPPELAYDVDTIDEYRYALAHA